MPGPDPASRHPCRALGIEAISFPMKADLISQFINVMSDALFL